MRPARRYRGSGPTSDGRYPVQVRFSDVDVYGHVNNVKYFEYFQEARILLQRPSCWEGLDRISIVVAQTDVDYRVPILFRPEPYDAWSWVARVGTRSATIESLILRRRHGLVPRPRDHRLLRPGDPALDRARRPRTSTGCVPARSLERVDSDEVAGPDG